MLLRSPRRWVRSTYSQNSDGTISINAVKDFAGNPKRFQEIAPMLFRELDGQSRVAFTKDYAGRLDRRNRSANLCGAAGTQRLRVRI